MVPFAILGPVGVTFNVVTVAASTVTWNDELIEPYDTVTVAVPGATKLTRPVLETVITELSELE